MFSLSGASRFHELKMSLPVSPTHIRRYAHFFSDGGGSFEWALKHKFVVLFKLLPLLVEVYGVPVYCWVVLRCSHCSCTRRE